MKYQTLLLALAFSLAGTMRAQEAQVTPLTSKDLTDLPGKEGLMITVVYPPGSSDPVHRHNAHAFVYVLEGSIVMQVKGGKEITLNPGQTSHPAHRHVNEELIIMDSGECETLSDGKWIKVTKGDIIFNASNSLHQFRNVGKIPAQYHVINWSPNKDKK